MSGLRANSHRYDRSSQKTITGKDGQMAHASSQNLGDKISFSEQLMRSLRRTLWFCSDIVGWWWFSFPIHIPLILNRLLAKGN
jgi:hypothetical protein